MAKKILTAMSPAAETLTLYFREGSSDKVYTASLEKSGAGWVVNFAYGRRGSALTAGTKTAQPVEFAAAKKTYDKLIAEKTGKGYTPGEDGVAFKHTSSEERDSGVRMMLLNDVEESELERLFNDDAWGAQEKMDGRRQAIKGTTADVVGINRKGLIVAPAETIVQACTHLQETFTIDGEAIGDTLYAFDILLDGAVDCKGDSFYKRHVRLAKVISRAGKHIKQVPLVEGTAAKKALFAELKARKAEGIVFKLLSAPYTAGRPDKGGNALKFKFYARGSFIVARHNAKRSVALKLFDGTEMGNVTITPNKAVPPVGSIAEVEYLYAYKGGSLFQPHYLETRDDIELEACTAQQLKYKAGSDEEDA